MRSSSPQDDSDKMDNATAGAVSRGHVPQHEMLLASPADDQVQHFHRNDGHKRRRRRKHQHQDQKEMQMQDEGGRQEGQERQEIFNSKDDFENSALHSSTQGRNQQQQQQQQVPEKNDNSRRPAVPTSSLLKTKMDEKAKLGSRVGSRVGWVSPELIERQQQQQYKSQDTRKETPMAQMSNSTLLPPMPMVTPTDSNAQMKPISSADTPATSIHHSTAKALKFQSPSPIQPISNFSPFSRLFPESPYHNNRNPHKPASSPSLSPMTPTTSHMLSKSPFIHSVRLLDEKLDSVKRDESRLQSKIEKMNERWTAEQSLEYSLDNHLENSFDYLEKEIPVKTKMKEMSEHDGVGRNGIEVTPLSYDMAYDAGNSRMRRRSSMPVTPSTPSQDLRNPISHPNRNVRDQENDMLQGNLITDMDYSDDEDQGISSNIKEPRGKSNRSNRGSHNKHDRSRHGIIGGNGGDEHSHDIVTSDVLSDLSGEDSANEDHEQDDRDEMEGLLVSFNHDRRNSTHKDSHDSLPSAQSDTGITESDTKISLSDSPRKPATFWDRIQSPLMKRSWSASVKENQRDNRDNGSNADQSSQSIHGRNVSNPSGKNHLQVKKNATTGSNCDDSDQRIIDVEISDEKGGTAIGAKDEKPVPSHAYFVEGTHHKDSNPAAKQRSKNAVSGGNDGGGGDGDHDSSSKDSNSSDDSSSDEEHERDEKIIFPCISPNGFPYHGKKTRGTTSNNNHGSKQDFVESPLTVDNSCLLSVEKQYLEMGRSTDAEKRKNGGHSGDRRDMQRVFYPLEATADDGNSVVASSTCSSLEFRTNRVLWRDEAPPSRSKPSKAINSTLSHTGNFDHPGDNVFDSNRQFSDNSLTQQTPSPNMARQRPQALFSRKRSPYDMESPYSFSARNTFPSRIDEIDSSLEVDDDKGKGSTSVSTYDTSLDSHMFVSHSVGTRNHQHLNDELVEFDNKPTQHSNENEEMGDSIGIKSSLIDVGGMFKRMTGWKSNHSNDMRNSDNGRMNNDLLELSFAMTPIQESCNPSDLKVQSEGRFDLKRKEDAYVSALKKKNAYRKQQFKEVSTERKELMNVISEMRRQLTNVTNERDSLMLERDSNIQRTQKYQSENKALNEEVKSLEAGMQLNLRHVKEVQEALAKKEDDVTNMSDLLRKSEITIDRLHSVLSSKESAIKELSRAIESHKLSVTKMHMEKEELRDQKSKLEHSILKLSNEMASHLGGNADAVPPANTSFDLDPGTNSSLVSPSQIRTRPSNKQLEKEQFHCRIASTANIITDESIDDEDELEEAVSMVLISEKKSPVKSPRNTSTSSFDTLLSVFNKCQHQIENYEAQISHLKAENKRLTSDRDGLRHQLSTAEQTATAEETKAKQLELEVLELNMQKCEIENSLIQTSQDLTDLRIKLGHEEEMKSSLEEQNAKLQEDVGASMTRLDEVESQLEDLSKLKEAADEEIKELATKCCDIEGRLGTVMTEKESLLSQVKEKSAMVSNLTSEKDILETKVKDLETNRVHVANSIETLDKAENGKVIKLEEAQARTRLPEEQLRSPSSKSGVSKRKYENLVIQRDTLMSSYIDLQMEVTKFKEQQELLAKKVECYQADICRLTSENENLTSQVDDLRGQVSSFQQAVHDEAKRSEELELKALYLTQQKSEMEKSLLLISEENTELYRKIKVDRELKSDLDNRLSGLKIERDSLAGQISALSNKIFKQDGLLESRTSEIASLTAATTATTSEMNELQERFETVTMENTETRGLLASIEEELNRHRRQEEELLASREYLCWGHESLRECLSFAEAELTISQEKCSGLEKALCSSRDDAAKNAAAKGALESLLEESHNQVRSLSEKNDSLVTQSGNHLKCIQHHEFNAKSLEEEISELKLERASILHDLCMKERDVELKSAEIASLCSEKLSMKAEMENLERTMISTMNEKNELDSLLSRAKDEEEEMNHSIEGLVEEKKSQERSLNMIEESLKASDKMVAKLKSKLEAGKSEACTLRDENSRTKEELALLKKERDDLSAELDKVKRELKGAIVHRETLASSRDTTHVQSENLSDQINLLETDRTLLLKRLQEIEQHFSSNDSDSEGETISSIASSEQLQGVAAKLTVKVLKLKMQTKRAKKKNQHLSTQLSSACKNVSLLEKQLKESNTDRKDLGIKLVMEREKLKSLEVEKQKLLDLVASNTKDIGDLRTTQDTAVKKILNILSIGEKNPVDLSTLANAHQQSKLLLSLAALESKCVILDDKLRTSLSVAFDDANSEKPFIEPTVPTAEKNLQRTVAKLAMVSVKLKIRASKLSRKTLSQRSQIIDLQSQLDEAKHHLNQQLIAAQHASQLSSKLSILTNERDSLVSELEECQAKNAALEIEAAELESNRQTHYKFTLELAKKVSSKDAENEQLNAAIDTKNKMLDDVKQQIEALQKEMSKTDVVHSCSASGLEFVENERHVIAELKARLQSESELLKDVKDQLHHERETVIDLNYRLERMDSEREMSKCEMTELRAAKLHAENSLNEILRDRENLTGEVEMMHDTITILEAEKESLSINLGGCEEKLQRLESEVVSLKAKAESTSIQLQDTESMFESKMQETSSLNDTVLSHELSLETLQAEMSALNREKTIAENKLSELHSKINCIMCERDDLASQLDKAHSELKVSREEREKLVYDLEWLRRMKYSCSGDSNSADFVCDGFKFDDNETVLSEDYSAQKQLIDVLNLSQISEQDIDRVCDKMNKAQSIIAQIEKERKLLKREIKNLRVELGFSRGELAATKKECAELNQLTETLRGEVKNTRLLLKESESENDQMAMDLLEAQEKIEQIRRESTKSYSSLAAQSHEEISKLKEELMCVDESRIMPAALVEPIEDQSKMTNETVLKSKKISKFDISFETVVASNKAKATSTVKSKDRFKIERGQSMFGILKDIKKSGRKGNIKYRHFKTEENNND